MTNGVSAKAGGFTCPICGNDQLTANPYKAMPPISAAIYEAEPPYEKVWGAASYEVCGCCGFEFGNDDNGMDTALNSSFSDYLFEWLTEEGGEWFWPDEKPQGWSLRAQLQRAGIPLSDRVRAAVDKLEDA